MLWNKHHEALLLSSQAMLLMVQVVVVVLLLLLWLTCNVDQGQRPGHQSQTAAKQPLW
jgi:hypothetical protein